ncbi:hypothetical protein Dda_3174 [Drechslerella dactyloides]|uniref:Uncharacterized protein n=1 Tax=Drechslerella dactyloides TaxID=74499 RepID=A0AAD6J5A3_DREDA|nr:hypothetical protein Dda_3174 [Drechslerella dactyloides]
MQERHLAIIRLALSNRSSLSGPKKAGRSDATSHPRQQLQVVWQGRDNLIKTTIEYDGPRTSGGIPRSIEKVGRKPNREESKVDVFGLVEEVDAKGGALDFDKLA